MRKNEGIFQNFFAIPPCSIEKCNRIGLAKIKLATREDHPRLFALFDRTLKPTYAIKKMLACTLTVVATALLISKLALLIIPTILITKLIFATFKYTVTLYCLKQKKRLEEQETDLINKHFGVNTLERAIKEVASKAIGKNVGPEHLEFIKNKYKGMYLQISNLRKKYVEDNRKQSRNDLAFKSVHDQLDQINREISKNNDRVFRCTNGVTFHYET